MAYQNIEIGDRANTQYKEYVCDSVEDLANIPQEFAAMALVIGDGSGSQMYICGSDGWKKA